MNSYLAKTVSVIALYDINPPLPRCLRAARPWRAQIAGRHEHLPGILVATSVGRARTDQFADSASTSLLLLIGALCIYLQVLRRDIVDLSSLSWLSPRMFQEFAGLLQVEPLLVEAAGGMESILSTRVPITATGESNE